MADGDDEDDELGVPKLADDAIVAQAITRQAKCIWTKRPEGIKDAALKGDATTARLAKGTRVCRPADPRAREIPHTRGPTLSQERKRKKKSACSVRNDVRVIGSWGRLTVLLYSFYSQVLKSFHWGIRRFDPAAIMLWHRALVFFLVGDGCSRARAPLHVVKSRC